MFCKPEQQKPRTGTQRLNRFFILNIYLFLDKL